MAQRRGMTSVCPCMCVCVERGGKGVRAATLMESPAVWLLVQAVADDLGGVGGQAPRHTRPLPFHELAADRHGLDAGALRDPAQRGRAQSVRFGWRRSAGL